MNDPEKKTASEIPGDFQADSTELSDRLKDLGFPVFANSEPDSESHEIGKYRLVKTIAIHGQSTVFRAFDPDLNREVALKLYHSALDQKQRQRVLSEGRALAQIKSPYVATCFSVESVVGAPFLVMEWIEGQTLSDWSGGKELTFARIRELFFNISEGVAAIHSCGLVHCDLKPGNVIVTSDGTPRIVDFGLVSAENETTNSAGTCAYMAPEVANQQTTIVNFQTDVFGLGALLYFLLTGRPLYAAKLREHRIEQARNVDFVSLEEIRSDIPSDLLQICEKCLNPVPEDRYADATQLLKLRRQKNPFLSWAAIGLAFLVLSISAASLGYLFRTPKETAGNLDGTAQAQQEKPLPPLTQAIFLAAEGDPKSSADIVESIMVPLLDDEAQIEQIREKTRTMIGYLLQIPDVSSAISAADRLVEIEKRRANRLGSLPSEVWLNEAIANAEQVKVLSGLDKQSLELLATGKLLLHQAQWQMAGKQRNLVIASSRAKAAIEPIKNALGDNHIEYYRALWNHTFHQFMSNDLKDIESNLAAIETGLQSIFGGQSSELALLYENRSNLLHRLNGFPDAGIPDVKKAIEVAEAMQLDEGATDLCSLRIHLVYLLVEARRLDEAHPLLDKLIDELNQQGIESLGLARLWHFKSRMDLADARLDSARVAIDQAIGVADASFEKSDRTQIRYYPVSMAIAMTNANLMSKEGKHHDAKGEANRAIEIMRRVGADSNKIRLATGLLCLAETELAAGDLDSADANARVALEAIQSEPENPAVFPGADSDSLQLLAEISFRKSGTKESKRLAELAIKAESSRLDPRPLHLIRSMQLLMTIVDTDASGGQENLPAIRSELDSKIGELILSSTPFESRQLEKARLNPLVLLDSF